MATTVTDPCSEGSIRSGKATAACLEARGRWVLAATILASSMAFIDGTVVNVALPFLQRDLNATVIGVQWVVEAYSLFLAALLLVGGSLGDHYGRRFIFTIGVILFAVSSAACGFAGNIEQLIVARAIQGIGGAMLIPGSLAIISASFDEAKRGRAIGTWSGFSAMTTAVGPVLGGWLVEHVSWRAVFYLNIPFALAVVIIAFWKIPESKDPEATGRLDWVGAALATIGLGGLVYGLIESSRVGFSNPVVLISLVGGAVALVLFIFNEARAANPMVPLRLFRSHDFAGANLLTLLLYSALGAMMFFFALNLIQVQKYPATAAGAALLPFVVIMFSLSRWSGGLVDRFGARLPLIVGPVIAAIGLALFAVPSVGAGYWTSFFPAVVVLGFGMAISVAPLTTTVMNSVSATQSGVASGINNAVSRVAGLLAIAVFGVIVLNTFSGSLARRLNELPLDDQTKGSIYEQRVKLAGIDVSAIAPNERAEVDSVVGASFVDGFRLIMFICSGLAIASAFSSWLLISNKKTGRSGTNQQGKNAN